MDDPTILAVGFVVTALCGFSMLLSFVEFRKVTRETDPTRRGPLGRD